MAIPVVPKLPGDALMGVRDEQIVLIDGDDLGGGGGSGADGLSAYQIAVNNGYVGSEATWVASLPGRSAYQSAVDQGFPGTEGEWVLSLPGPAGDDAYQIAVEGGFVGDKPTWILSLNGADGKSAYQSAVDVGGFVGTEGEWLLDLKGEPGADSTVAGPPGKSAYQSAVDVGGFVGTEGEWIDSIEGVPGDPGASAYELAGGDATWGSLAAWQVTLIGPPGDNGSDSVVPGPDGLSAYQVALANEFVGTESEWLESLIPPGVVQEILEGVGISVDSTDPTRPMVSFNGETGGVTQTYVDDGDAATLLAAIDYINSHTAELGPELTIPFGTWEVTGAIPPTQDAVTNTAHFVNVPGIGSVKYTTDSINPETEYEVTFTILNHVEGAAQAALYSEVGTLGHLCTQRDANGTFTERVTTAESVGLINQIRLRTIGEGTFDITDFSVKEVITGGTGGGSGSSGTGVFLDATQYIQAGDLGNITMAINRALDVSLNVGLPEGTYDMDTDLLFRDGMHLTGTCWATSASSATARINCNNGASIINGNTTRKNIRIEKLKFYGPGPGGSARAISGGFGGTVEECFFEGFDVCVGNGSSYLSRYFRNSWNDCNFGVSVADAHGTRFQDNFSAGDCKTMLSMVHEPVIQVGVGSNKGTPVIIDGNNVSQGTAGGTGNVGMYLCGNITGRVNYFEDYSISPSGNTFVDLLVGRFDDYGFHWINNEMNGQGEAAHAFRIHGSHPLECRANGLIAHNRIFGYSGNAIQYGDVGDLTTNYISHLQVYDNGPLPVSIGNAHPWARYHKMAEMGHATSVAVAGATWVILPITQDVRYDNCDAAVGANVIRWRDTEVVRVRARIFPLGEVQLSRNGVAIQIAPDGIIDTYVDMDNNLDLQLKARNGTTCTWSSISVEGKHGGNGP